MGIGHTQEQNMLKDMVAPFLAENAPVKHMRNLRDADDKIGFSRGLWKQFAELGLTGILIPETEGGLGLGHVEAGIVLEQIGRNLTPSPFLATAVAGAQALKNASAEMRGNWYPKIVSGDAIIGLAIDESSKHRPQAVELIAERMGNGFRLNGSKQFVLHGHIADLLLVSARTSGATDEEAGISLFAIARDTKGIEVQTDRLVDSQISARISFENVELNGDAVIGDIDGGWSPLQRLLNAGRIGAAAEMIGVGGGAMDITFEYLKTRKQFDHFIGEFHALQHRAAHLYGEMEGARAIVLKAQHLLDDDDSRAELFVAAAKAKAGLAANLAVREGVQMHGGVGMTDEFDIGLYMKRDRALAEFFGDINFQANRVALLNGY
ncbi:MAG: acyl-CoA dehydrogenase-like protein [Hyphomonadaceae bacterium]|nr:MAG: acyl-CoA dehydrogenase-like protein [Hyphomonadaceae bacterium]